ncbi:DUF4398 domain-containing protein [Vulcaniibacterium thermophilum]|uniref:Membrane protein n=1 Tax=Vulcaniibacterium thermophilum TaxID=1169913 RepID=A0A918Z8X9_9GAMM|nr:DUF4398 domain-containing protein [Vulcaniibacterium thermophilum]GHE41073.1 membrane protein [Vulcaniibacterium thermophilum]
MLSALILGFVMVAQAATPAPLPEVAGAQEAIARAEQADADQYASLEIAAARGALQRAQQARRKDDARAEARAAAADADLAYFKSREAVLNAQVTQRRAEIAELRERLQTGEGR